MARDGISIRGIAETLGLMRRTASRVQKFELEMMEKYSKKLVDLARRYAPREFGHLEASIDRWPDKEGPRHRKIWWVGVDEKELGSSFQTYGHRYDIYQHERAHKPSQASIDKGTAIGLPAGGTAENRIGSQYLARAAQQIEVKMRKETEVRLNRELKGAGW